MLPQRSSTDPISPLINDHAATAAQEAKHKNEPQQIIKPTHDTQRSHVLPRSPHPRRPHRLFRHICAHRYPWESDGERGREKEIPLALTCASPPRWSSSLWLHLIRTLALHSRALLHGHACGGLEEGWGWGQIRGLASYLSAL